jgi:negative regulator of sigma-B (phosphoserine phosphatase)
VKNAIDWISTPKDGEIENGDLAIVRRDEANPASTLLVVADGLGHGPHAAAVSRAVATLVLESSFPAGPLETIEALHERLKGTRGAAVLVCLVADHKLEACSVGNVEMRTWRSRIPIVLTPGIVGSQLRKPRVFSGELPDEDRIVVFTDGVSSRFVLSDLRALSAAEACKAIMKANRRPHDDATVMVADFAVH